MVAIAHFIQRYGLRVLLIKKTTTSDETLLQTTRFNIFWFSQTYCKAPKWQQNKDLRCYRSQNLAFFGVELRFWYF